jgi:ligand-binding sensor domain-containing protein/signal transduction histidine kinase
VNAHGIKLLLSRILAVLVVSVTLFSPVLTIPVFAQSNSIRFENISTEQGLSQNTVNAILQDQQGFLWFATEGGLNRYDGYQFTVFQHDPDDQNSLSDNLIYTIFQDRQGELWIGTVVGLDRFDRPSGTFIHYAKYLIGSDSLSGEPVSVIIQDLSGALWIGTEGDGLRVLDLVTTKVTEYRHKAQDPHSLADDNILSIAEDREGRIWIGTSAGLDQFNSQTGSFAHFLQASTNSPISTNAPVQAIYEDGQGLFWIGTQQGLVQWDRPADRFTLYNHDSNLPGSLSSNSIKTIFEDSRGTLWVGTLSGLNQYDRETNTFIRYMHDPSDPTSLSSDYVRAIFKDRSGVLWIGSSDGGLDKYALSTQKFTLIKNRSSAQTSLSDNNIWAIDKDRDGNLWIGTFFSGLNKLDLASGRVTIYQNDPADSASISNDEIRAILEDRNGSLWIGTERGGLNRLDVGTGSFIHYQHLVDDPGSLDSDNVFSLYEDKQGRLWVGTDNGGLNLFDPAKGTFSHFQHSASAPLSLSDTNVRAIYQDHSGALWIGTHGGLNLWENDGNQFKIFQHDSADPSSLSNDLVSSITEDKTGTLWVGTFGGGLDRFDRSTQSFVHFTTKNGLPDNMVLGILADADGNLWMSTAKGLSKFNPSANTFRNYDITDGLQGNQFNPGAYFQSSDGEMYFGGTKGINAFFPQAVSDNPTPPPVVITAFKKFNQTIRVDPASNESIQLSYNDNFISFEFAALDYNAPQKNQYAYMLEGVDQDWIYAGARRYASYTNLQGGTYTFRVKGSNNDGVWSEQATTLIIHITPPFWQTWWFLVIVGSTVIAGSLGGYRLRVRNIESRNRELLKRVEQRTHELAALNSISAVVNRSLDLTEILNAALDQTIKVMRMDGGLAYRLEETSSEAPEGPILRLLAHRGVADEYINLVKVLPLQATLIGETVKTGKPDVRLVNDHPNPQIRKAIEQARVRLAINVPLLVQGKLVGALTLANWELRAITQEELSLLTAISQQVAMAVVNARLYEQAGKRTHELEQHSKVAESLRDIVNKINSNATEDEVLDFIVSQVGDVLRDTKFVALWRLQSEQGPFRLHSFRGEFPEAMLKLEMNIDEGMLGMAVKERRTVYFQDMSRVQYAFEQAGIDENHPFHMTMPNQGILAQVLEVFKAIMVVPLLKQNGAYGALEFFYTAPREFTKEEITLASAFAEQASLAIENAGLRMQSAQAAILAERSRLARELHDSVTQLLYSVTLYAEAASELLNSGDTETAAGHLRDLRDTAQEALREMRLLIFELHRPVLGQGGLAAALQARLDAVERRGGMHADLQVEGKEQIPLPVQAELYNIAHEALNNVLKHAHANAVQIRLRFSNALTEMQISDDGVGFEPALDGSAGGFGIPGMQERAQKIGGTLRIESAPGHGTRVSLKVPPMPHPHPDRSGSGSFQKGME